MAGARSLLCGLRFGSLLRPLAGGLSVPARGSRYGPTFVEPIAYDYDHLKSIAHTPEVNEISYRPVKAAVTDVSNSIFFDPLLMKFINLLMRKGDKAQATELVQRALYSVKLMKPKSGLHPLGVFEQAVRNASPVLETTNVKRGGQIYQVPVPVTAKRARFIAVKWILEAAADKERHIRFYDQLARELVDAANNVGRVIKRKQESHKVAEANKAYAHYRY